MDVKEYIVPWLNNINSYSEEHLEYAWSHPQTLRMMSNENPMPPAEAVTEAILEATKMGNRYPDPGNRLRQSLADLNGCKKENVLLGNGSTDVIDIILRTFVEPGQEVIISIPTFSMYEKRARCNGMIPLLVPLKSDFSFDIDTMLNSIGEKTKLVIVCSPNNPTGQQIPVSDLVRLLGSGVPIVVDEAYYELENDPKSVSYLMEKFTNLIIIRTFSKAYGLAGLRLGYAFANSEIITYMEKVKLPWNVNLLTMLAALAQLHDTEDINKKRKVIIEGRNFIQQELSSIPRLIVYPSEGNFVLIDTSKLEVTSNRLFERMREEYGILLRPLETHHGKEGLIRITVGTREQNCACVEAIKEILAKDRHL